MSQIKEKAPAAPASVTSAKPVHIEDTIKNLIRQVEPVNFNLEDLFIWFQQSQDYRNRPQVDKADRKLTNRLITAVGRKTFSEYIEDEVANTNLEHEYQGFIYGFRVAVSLLNYASEEYCHDRKHKGPLSDFRISGILRLCGKTAKSKIN